MTEDTRQITADNLRADFLNANTTAERWKILNRALDWAVAASENASAQLRAVETLRGQGYVRHGERILSNGEHPIRVGDVVTWEGDEEGWIVKGIRESGDLIEIVRLCEDWRMSMTVVWAEALFP